jgi:hypothetical protein
VPAISSDISNLVLYALRALGNQQVTFQQLWLFLSFDIRQIKPSEAKHLIKRLIDKGDLTLQDEVLVLSEKMRDKIEAPVSFKMEKEASPLKELGDLLSHFVGQKRLSSAVGIEDSAVDIKVLSETPARIEARIQGTRVYHLKLDEDTKIIRHDCPDWLRKRKLRRFCKHVAKFFLMIERDEAVRLITSLLEEPWQFEAF